MASVMAAPVQVFAAWIVLARPSFVAPGSSTTWIHSLTWAIAGYFVLNTFGNLTSRSDAERRIITPVAAVLSRCLLDVALS